MKFLAEADLSTRPLLEREGLPAAQHVFEEASVEAVDFALACGRPLLVRGEPGTGKSQLARAAADALGRVFVHRTVDIQTEPRDLLYTLDSLARLAKAQLLSALPAEKAKDLSIEAALHEHGFLAPGPLWWAFDWTGAMAQAQMLDLEPPFQPPDWSGVVVLIDEIDKADGSVPSALLEALGARRFPLPGGGLVKLEGALDPLVVVTTNEERALPDAFLRRCVVLQLALPEGEEALVKWLAERGAAHFPRCGNEVRREAARQTVRDRKRAQELRLAAPGQAEYLDILRALEERAEHAEVADAKREDFQLTLLKQIAGFALRKHPELAGNENEAGA